MKYIVIGDLHFGSKGFNDDFFTHQLDFFHKQLFPYMKSEGIDTIIQLGDWLDNRKNMDIKFFNRMINEFCEPLKEHGFKFISFLGNHDIYYNSRLDVNLVKYFQELYPDNIDVIQKREKRMFGDQKYMFVPWMIDDTIKVKEIQDIDLLFGHFEIKNFEMVKGHVDQKSTLESNFFQKSKRLQRVISGHYHVQGTDGFVMYTGTPYQLNWGDYETERGFYVFDGTEIDFVENVISPKYIKIKYDDSQEFPINIKGLQIGHSESFKDVSKLDIDLTRHKVKFFINVAQDKNYESVIYELHQKGVVMDVINNVEISELIGTDFNHDIESEAPSEMIINRVKETSPHLLGLFNEIMSEIKEES